MKLVAKKHAARVPGERRDGVFDAGGTEC